MGRYLSMDTPSWIDDLIAEIEAERGQPGWIKPIGLDASHPLVTEGWTCFYCQEPFTPDHYGIVMPFGGFEGESSRWIASHRHCTVTALGLEENET